MPKFKMIETIPCYVTWECEIEADNEEHAKELFYDGDYPGAGEAAPVIGDTLDWAPSQLECEPVKEEATHA